jgi:serine/threonine-protein kinase RsbW
MAESARRSLVEAEVEPESLELVHDLLEEWWIAVGEVPMRRRFAFETAVIEIAGNVVEHSRRLDGAPGRRFSLVLDADARTLHARFEDNGLPAQVDLSTVTMAGLDDEDGRGLALAVASLDRLEHLLVDGKNVWELECGRA